MTAPAVTVKVDTSSGDIMKLFASGAFSALPVLDDEGRLAGVVSTTDVVRKVVASSEGSSARASDLMTSPAIVAKPGEPLDDAAWRLVAARAHRLVVVDGDEPIGVLSIRDVLGGLLHRAAPQPIRTIMSRPVETVEVGDSIAKAIHCLAYAGVHGLVVLDGARPVGVFTHAEALAARHLPPLLLEDPVEEVMSYETICFDGATPIDRVAASAATMNVRRVLVVEDKQLAGIVSDVDVVDALSRSGTDV
ncbi:MAG: CBS domain-containing protein [Labilithrix sp.]|nr:CBS domain-containing protein [Labilithrix sp.]MCW5812599.1 CBS domain-containing protein [Labilithrix sp.]